MLSFNNKFNVCQEWFLMVTCSGPVIDRVLVVYGSAMSFRDLFFPPSRITCQSFIRVLLGSSNSLASLIFEVFTPIGMPKGNIKILGDWDRNLRPSNSLCRGNDINASLQTNQSWHVLWIHVILLKIQFCFSLLFNWSRQMLLMNFFPTLSIDMLSLG